MTHKIKITQPGVYFASGEGAERVETEQKVGEIVTVKDLPLFAAGKYVVVGSDEDKALQANEKSADAKDLKEANEKLAEQHATLQAEFTKLKAENETLVADHGAVKTKDEESQKAIATLRAENEDLRKQLEAAKSHKGGK